MNHNQKVLSLDPIIDKNSQVLILGSMPGVESLTKKQYYANQRNHFWKIIFTIFDKEDSLDYSSRISFLHEYKIALWDVIHSCQRIGSLDSDIKYEKPNEIEKFLESYPNIKLILFNGGKSYEVFKKHIGLSSFSGIDLIKLPSTSPTPGKNVKSYEEKLKEWNIIKKYVINHS
jgi:hypoxanthine-DNA glycosylase